MSQLSKPTDNVVIGLVRDKAATEARVAFELNRKNLHIIQGDIESYEDLKVRRIEIFRS